VFLLELTSMLTLRLHSDPLAGRADAHRFYERLGFVASHEELKLKLPS
jgi:hypothetical protein